MRHFPELHRQQRGRRGALRFRRRAGRGFGWGELATMLFGGVLVGLAAASWTGEAPVVARSAAPVAIEGAETASTQFGFCHTGGGTNCVVDGDTFWMAGTRIRIADIDAPETHPPRCASEADRGARATQRLRALLNAGPVTLESADRDTDRYGRKLRIVTRGGESIGGMLVDEGLARRWTGRRQPWC